MEAHKWGRDPSKGTVCELCEGEWLTAGGRPCPGPIVPDPGTFPMQIIPEPHEPPDTGHLHDMRYQRVWPTVAFMVGLAMLICVGVFWA